MHSERPYTFRPCSFTIQWTHERRSPITVMYPSIRCFIFLLLINQVVICILPAKNKLNGVPDYSDLPFAWEANRLQQSHSEAARRQANFAHIKACTTPIISTPRWHFSVLLCLINHTQNLRKHLTLIIEESYYWVFFFVCTIGHSCFCGTHQWVCACIYVCHMIYCVYVLLRVTSLERRTMSSSMHSSHCSSGVLEHPGHLSHPIWRDDKHGTMNTLLPHSPQIQVVFMCISAARRDLENNLCF